MCYTTSRTKSPDLCADIRDVRHDLRQQAGQHTLATRLTLGPAYNVRIALGHTVNPRINHAQAQVQVDGVWHWLQFDGHLCFIGERDPQFAGEIYETVSIGEAIELLNK